MLPSEVRAQGGGRAAVADQGEDVAQDGGLFDRISPVFRHELGLPKPTHLGPTATLEDHPPGHVAEMRLWAWNPGCEIPRDYGESGRTVSPPDCSARGHASECTEGPALTIQGMAGSYGPAEARIATVETTASDGWHAAVALRGEIDAAVAPALCAELEGHLEAGRHFIRIDTAGVTFLDSTAIGALVTWSRRCAEVHGALILTNVPARARRLIRMMGLETLLLIDRACDARHDT